MSWANPICSSGAYVSRLPQDIPGSIHAWRYHISAFHSPEERIARSAHRVLRHREAARGYLPGRGDGHTNAGGVPVVEAAKCYHSR